MCHNVLQQRVSTLSPYMCYTTTMRAAITQANGDMSMSVLDQNDDSAIENDDSSIENDDSAIENDDSSIENDDSAIENDDSSIANDDSCVEKS